MNDPQTPETEGSPQQAGAPRGAAADGAAAGSAQVSGPSPLRLGFTRGVAPSKWASRWRAAAARPLELVPLAAPFGRGRASEGLDVVIERAAPGARPDGSEAPADGQPLAEGTAEPAPRHAMRLYEEAVALVLPKDHELAELEEIPLSDLPHVRILSHPNHSPEWPAAEPWEDPSWEPKNLAAALELVATGLGGIVLPLPLARHATAKREHAVLRIVGDSGERNPLPGSTIWATWSRERDDAEVQQLAGVLRGRTARSSRTEQAAEQEKPSAKQPRAKQPAKKKPKLKPNSRGAQLQAAKEKAERARAERRRAKRR